MSYRIKYEKLICDRRMIDGILFAYNSGELHTLSTDYIKNQEEKRCAKLTKKLNMKNV